MPLVFSLFAFVPQRYDESYSLMPQKALRERDHLDGKTWWQVGGRTA
jgi:hypothetical protein